MKIRKDDKVIILQGKDKGKSGKVLQCFPKEGMVVVEGLNIRTKHLRARDRSQKGQKIMYPAPVAISNVMLLCSACGARTRIGITRTGDTRQRTCKKCNASF